jgi:hypothetical protein
MIDELLLKLYLMSLVEYETDKIFEKSKEDFEQELAEWTAKERAELIESYGKIVDESFEKGGRWSNFTTTVYEFWHNREFVYISITREVPATEAQEGGDFMDPEIEQVYPHKIETTIYKSFPQENGRN